uniref:Uncharacterized protein n=1 Tax=Physcomitrium patens TaxID=3218 RepID=A0A2K1ITM1_PHYPA|nr:hypothetical protein PHYPA_024550 [Physcomitrium patens]
MRAREDQGSNNRRDHIELLSLQVKAKQQRILNAQKLNLKDEELKWSQNIQHSAWREMYLVF